jgi:hypothetical protein
MALNFPTNPTLGQIYIEGDRSFIWNGVSWLYKNEYLEIKTAIANAINEKGGSVTIATPFHMYPNAITELSGDGGTGEGVVINGLIESYKVKVDETIDAGDFVDFFEEYEQTETNFVSGMHGVGFTAVKFNSTQYILFFTKYNGGNFQSFAKIITVDNNGVTVDETNYVLNSNFVYNTKAVLLRNNKVLVLQTSSSGSELFVIEFITPTGIIKSDVFSLPSNTQIYNLFEFNSDKAIIETNNNGVPNLGYVNVSDASPGYNNITLSGTFSNFITSAPNGISIVVLEKGPTVPRNIVISYWAWDGDEGEEAGGMRYSLLEETNGSFVLVNKIIEPFAAYPSDIKGINMDSNILFINKSIQDNEQGTAYFYSGYLVNKFNNQINKKQNIPLLIDHANDLDYFLSYVDNKLFFTSHTTDETLFGNLETITTRVFNVDIAENYFSIVVPFFKEILIVDHAPVPQDGNYIGDANLLDSFVTSDSKIITTYGNKVAATYPSGAGMYENLYINLYNNIPDLYVVQASNNIKGVAKTSGISEETIEVYVLEQGGL